jgi:hypothetical protein
MTMPDYHRMRNRKALIRERNAAMRAALCSGLNVAFTDLGHYAVSALFSVDGKTWFTSAAEARKNTFVPVASWPAVLTCAGCGAREPLDDQHRCAECCRAAAIRERHGR